jgi:hypothetical protein
MNQNFEKYVQRRLAASGAMTPGQKLEVIKGLIEEAKAGKVPVGENAVARLPQGHPAVQAVLRGEQVSMGSTVVPKDMGFKGLGDRRVAMGLMIGSVLIMVLTLVFGSRLIFKAPEPSPTPAATQVPLPTSTPMPLPTQIPPTALPLPTATPAFSMGIGGPAENNRDPASIEISGRLFIVSRGIVDDNGKWAPAGPEWLEGTEVRRVFAVPYSAISDLPVQTGDTVRVRTRGGAVLEYNVREVLHLMGNQIETFISLRPSVVIFVPMNAGDVNTSEKIAVLAEAPLATSSSGSSEPAASDYIHASTNSGVNLRKDPGLNTQVLLGLSPGTQLAVSNYPSVSVNGVEWIYVAVIQSSTSKDWIYGWLAREYVSVE